MKNEIEEISNDLGMDVEIDVYQKGLSMTKLIEECYSPGECYTACSKCKNFGKLWCCPPYEDDYVERFKNNNIDIVVTQIRFKEKEREKPNEINIYFRICQEVHRVLLRKESEIGGTALSFVGNCSFCSPVSCARQEGKPCRHPEKARRSLEGIGFNVGHILNKFFDLTLDWSDKDESYSYLTFVAGLLRQ